MSEAHKRPKQPERLRTDLLHAAMNILAEKGAQALTLAAVSEATGVSKGGLQHHFRSKADLIDAMNDAFIDSFDACLKDHAARDADARARLARAYIHACMNWQPGNETNAKALNHMMFSFPEAQRRWRQYMEQAVQADAEDGADATTLLICRLAADGLWFSQFTKSYPLDRKRTEHLYKTLLDMTRQEA